MDTEKIDLVAKILLIIGGLNWGLVAIGPKLELVQYLQVGWLIGLVYALVGLAALYEIYALVKQ